MSNIPPPHAHQKQEQTPVLTIAIPTFNGADSVLEVLNSINSINTEDTIEIVVSNNCSTDSTESICKNFSPNRNILFKYSCNDSNLGYDRNVLKVISLASAEYVWLLSDNEMLTDKNGINKIKDLICKYKPAFILLEHDAPIDIHKCSVVYEDTNKFFIDTKFKGGLISSCIVNKKLSEKIDYSPYIDKAWIHFAYQIEVLSPLNKDLKVCVLKDRIFKSIPTSRAWGTKGTFMDVGFVLLDIFSNLKRLGYSSSVIRAGKYVIKGGYPENIRLAKKQGYHFSLAVIKRMINYYKEFPSFWILDLPVIILPIPLSKPIIKISKLLKKVFK